MAGQLIEVRADVPRVGHPAVHAANAPSNKHGDAGQSRPNERATDGGGAERAFGKHHRHVSSRDLEHAWLRSQTLEGRGIASNLHCAVDHGHRGGHRPFLANDGLDRLRRLQIGGVRHAVGHNRGLQGHRGAAFVQGLLNFRQHPNQRRVDAH